MTGNELWPGPILLSTSPQPARLMGSNFIFLSVNHIQNTQYGTTAAGRGESQCCHMEADRSVDCILYTVLLPLHKITNHNATTVTIIGFVNLSLFYVIYTQIWSFYNKYSCTILLYIYYTRHTVKTCDLYNINFT